VGIDSAKVLEVRPGGEIASPELALAVAEREEVLGFDFIGFLVEVLVDVVEVGFGEGVSDGETVPTLLGVDEVEQSVIVLVGLSIGCQAEVVAQQVHDFIPLVLLGFVPEVAHQVFCPLL